MSTLKVTNIQDTAGANSLTTAQLYNGSAKAWVNFNGYGTIGVNSTIRASFNVSSVSKSATGTYTINFTTAFADTNYSAYVIGSCPPSGGTTNGFTAFELTTAAQTSGRTVSSFPVMTVDNGAAVADSFSTSVAVFR